MAERFLFKDVFNEKSVTYLAKKIKLNYSKFDEINFIKDFTCEYKTLELMQRNLLIMENLKEYLPNKFKKAAQILINSLETENTEYVESKNDDLTNENNSFLVMPQTYFISKYGSINENDYDISILALYEMTKRFSSEFGIRIFISKYKNKTLKILKKWTKDENVHVRRLVSEGIRPRLPWSSPLKEFYTNPEPIIKLLEELKDDKELYVRRSVANNLNDISKDNPEIVIKLFKKWINEKDLTKEQIKNRSWIIKHALRTLFKKENKDALKLLGFNKPKIINPKIKIINKELNIGDNFNFGISFTSKIKQKLMIDFVIHYKKSNGKNNEKVFKLSIKELNKNENFKSFKKVSFKQMTTRKHYPGKHYIELIINGERFCKEEFIVKK